MATLLELLFASYDRPMALDMLRDITVRAQAIDALEPQLVAAGMPPGMLRSSEGENLFVAVLSLRLKFPLEEAREKVALNIRMRDGSA